MKISVNKINKTFTPSFLERLDGSFSKNKVHAVNDISFDIKGGEAFGLLGDNGAGKTTTLRMLAGLSDPDSGEILVDGKTINSIGKAKYHSRVSFLTSEMQLDGFFTPNYLFFYFCGLNGLDKKEALARKRILFNEFSITQFEDRKIANLSTGMKQKVALAISAIPDPDLIIYDEPTNGLDMGSSKIVVDFLIAEKRRGKAIVLSSHIFDIVRRVCDRVGVLIQGRLVYTGQVKRLGDLEGTYFALVGKEAGQ